MFNSVVKPLFAVVILMALTSIAFGQETATTPGRPVRTDKIQREMQRQVETQMIERSLREGGPKRTTRYSPPVLAQIREDFLRIQVIDRKLSQSNSTAMAIDFKAIAKMTGEIR